MKHRIDRLWDGSAADPGEWVDFTVGPPTDTDPFLVLRIDAPVHGDPAPVGPPGSLDRLWEHEVVEIFIAGPGEAYTEIEVGPHGHHLVLRLAGRRRPVATGLPMRLHVEHRGSRWIALAELSGALLPPRPWTWNAYAIHGVGIRRRYLALHAVPGSGPDFHRLEHFEPFPA